MIIPKNLVSLRSIVLASSLVGFALVSSGQTVISVDLGNTPTLTSSQTAGFVPVSNWTVANGSPNFGGGVALSFDDGTASGATISSSTVASNRDAFSPNPTDPNGIMFDALAGAEDGLGTTFSFAGIPTTGVWASGYDVYVYVATWRNVGGTPSLDVSIGSTVFYAQLGTVSDFGGFELIDSTNPAAPDTSGNYVVFSGVTGSSFDLNAISSGNNGQNGISGIQIVAVPEPSVAATLSGVLALCITVMRRRRNR